MIMLNRDTIVRSVLKRDEDHPFFIVKQPVFSIEGERYFAENYRGQMSVIARSSVRLTEKDNKDDI